jgi:DNA-binding FrmR family transcriptional regulator
MMMNHSHTHFHYEKDKINLLLKTAKGQIDGIAKMYDNNRYCIDISKQILSVISILQQANALILSDHIQSCVREAIHTKDEDVKIHEITEILTKYLR